MITVDTNVVVRWIVQDDAEQSAAASRLFDRAVLDGARLHVPVVVVVETAWVLARFYGFTRRQIFDALSALVTAEELHLEHTAAIVDALAAYRDGRGDFADYLIRTWAQSRGALPVATFDRKLLGDDSFVHPDPGAWPDGTSLREDPPRYARGRRRVSSPTRA